MVFRSVDPAVRLCWPCLRGPHKSSVLQSANALQQHARVWRPREVTGGAHAGSVMHWRSKFAKLKAEGRSERAIAIALKIPRSTVNEVLVEKGAYKRELANTAKGQITRS